MVAYGRADTLGIERSKVNIRNVSRRPFAALQDTHDLNLQLGAKLLGKRRAEEEAEAKAAKEGKGTLGKVSAGQEGESKA